MLDQKGTHTVVNLYSDSCAGQNRTRAMISMLIYFLKTAITITQIKVTYLLPGHTMMPVDSIHSTVESFVRNKTVWAPSEWPTMITNVRCNPKSYIVNVSTLETSWIGSPFHKLYCLLNLKLMGIAIWNVTPIMLILKEQKRRLI